MKQQSMMRESFLAPNLVEGQGLTLELLDQWSLVFEDTAASGRRVGLVSPANGKGMFDPYLDPADVLNLDAIHAIGERGLSIYADRKVEGAGIAPFDTKDLSQGTHEVYACLSWEKAPCGDMFEEPGLPGTSSPILAPRFRRARIVLEAGENRLTHRDWIHVARIVREQRDGLSRTLLDTRFHPPVRDMSAYARRNPLLMLCEKALQDLVVRDGSKPATSLRVELTLLRNIAQTATPLAAFAQAQRCLGLLQLEGLFSPPLNQRLQSFRFDPRTFCDFLAHLQQELDQPVAPRFPESLKIDEAWYLRLAGEFGFNEAGFLAWDPDAPDRMARALAIYMPGADRSLLPVVRYGFQSNDDGRFDVAVHGEVTSSSGAAYLLKKLPHPLTTIYVTSTAGRLFQSLRHHLGDGHGVYYC